LFYNPSLASVRFELGVLYYRLGSYEMARSYFASALTMKDLTPALRQRSEDLIADIDKKLQPDQFSGYVQSGFRYQTNAALGPGGGDCAGLGQGVQQHLCRAARWELVRRVRPELHPRFRATERQYVRGFGGRL
jgi:hypothetical protein